MKKTIEINGADIDIEFTLGGGNSISRIYEPDNGIYPLTYIDLRSAGSKHQWAVGDRIYEKREWFGTGFVFAADHKYKKGYKVGEIIKICRLECEEDGRKFNDIVALVKMEE